MMRLEATWLGKRLEAFPVEDLSPMLSVGSGTKAFRATFQPWIETAVYEPLARRHVEVLHHEMEPAVGVDVVGDLGKQDVRDHMRELGVRSVMCLNVFEHVLDRAGLAEALVASLPPGGLLVVTVPVRFPYHADPIDTLFRPTSSELASLFSGVTVIDSGNVKCESLLRHWFSKPGKSTAIRKVLTGLRRGRPTSGADATDHRQFSGPSLGATVAMMFWSTEISYVVLRKPVTRA